MIRMLLTVAVLSTAGSFAGLAMAQSKQGETSGSDVSSLVARLQAQCAHRRHTMPPDERDHCARMLRDTQTGYGSNGASANNQAALAGPGNVGAIGPGNIGPGNGNGNGKAKGR
jgi:hypothetical protein